MKLFGSKPVPKKESPSRVSKLSNHDLAAWGNTTIMQLGAAYDAWQYHDGFAEEVRESLDALISIWSELEARQGDRPS